VFEPVVTSALVKVQKPSWRESTVIGSGASGWPASYPQFGQWPVPSFFMSATATTAWVLYG
jgi:hypothetical protein